MFERLGKSIDKFELAVSDSEYEAIAYRAEIGKSIENRDYETLTKLISQYHRYNDVKRPIHKQYRTAMEAMAWYVRDLDYASCFHLMEQALACTLDQNWRQMLKAGQRLCNQEIKIILAITYCQWKLGDTGGLAQQMELLGRYILYHYTDAEEQVKVYPHCAWLLGQLYLEQGRVEDAYAVCRKGRESLTENGSLSPLWEILELEDVCLEKLGKREELLRCRKVREAVAFLYETAGARPQWDALAALMNSSFQGEFVITNELVRDLREAKGLSQEQLCDHICSQETLSRIEQGKRSPNKKKLYQLLKRMGMERENYYGFIEADDYELYEKVREYKRCIPKGRPEEAKKLLTEIENGVDMAKTANKQFIEMRHFFDKAQQGTISHEESNHELRRLLYLTMPPVDSGRLVYRVPFRTEYSICNKMAGNLRSDGKLQEAIQIYEQLMDCYEKSKVSMRYHAVSGLTLYTNYSGCLEENNELERAERIGREGLCHFLECGRGDVAGHLLANMSLIYEKRGLFDIAEKFFRYGYYIAEFYGRNRAVGILREAYREKFHKEFDGL